MATFALSKGRKDRSNDKTLKYGLLHDKIKFVNEFEISDGNYNIF